MVEFETIGEPITLTLPNGRFIEISKIAVISETGKKEFFSISQGEFYLSLDKQNAKRYKKNISIPENKIEDIIKALEDIQTRH